jgi:hypothetical protein
MASDKTDAPKKGGLAMKLDRALSTGDAVKRRADQAAAKVREAGPPSPNPMTNLMIADIVLRGGGRFLRHLVEANLLKSKYPPEKARSIIAGRGMMQTLLGTAVARVATRSVPGAIVVGGGLLVKAIYDRRKGEEAKARGEKAVNRRAARGE